ncbi:MAG TPA: methyltransferase domain-containing protein [Solirubrobacteraceae bacterium]|jgi:2-polyprenyl-3-methyl-5-hydroxy-6-metoxy-1,4-benzoquinol methylase|nr:methyltransferase domain-containing protein [Solirubrobacteraceae bacterium]
MSVTSDHDESRASDQNESPASRAAEVLLAQGAAGAAVRSLRGRLRAGLRSALLRALRPYSHPQRQLDERVVAALREHEADMARLEWEIRRREDRIDRLEVFVSDMVAAVETLRQSAARSDDRVSQVAWAATELRALPYMAGEALDSFELEGLGRVLGFRDASPHPDADDYVAFEDVFRGPPGRVADAQRPYLAMVRDHAPVLDVGCGRGEFLELLAAEGIPARGVDVDAGMVAACAARGLSSVVQADANAYLEETEPGELGAIFSAQVIEHMPYDAWRRFLALSLETLKPGGVLIFETVNPHRVASMKTFWVDPAHCHPIFPEAALVVCRTVGFSSAWAFAPDRRDFASDPFSSPAYAVLARKAVGAD